MRGRGGGAGKVKFKFSIFLIVYSRVINTSFI